MCNIVRKFNTFSEAYTAELTKCNLIYKNETTLDIKAAELADQFQRMHEQQQEIFRRQYSLLQKTISALNMFVDNRTRGAKFIFTKYKTLKQKATERLAGFFGR